MKLEYRSEDHTYWADGVRQPGIHEIAEARGVIDSSVYPESARKRGSYVEEAIYLDAKGRLDENSCRELMGYVHAWRKAKQELRIEPLSIELLVHNPELGYMTRIDMPALVAGEAVSINLKSGPPEPFHALQAAAELLAQPKIRRALYLHIQADGDYFPKWYGEGEQGRKDKRVWKAVCIAHDWKVRSSSKSARPRGVKPQEQEESITLPVRTPEALFEPAPDDDDALMEEALFPWVDDPIEE